MSRTFDRVASATSGRYFPISHHELVTVVSDLVFSIHPYHGRLSILLENCLVECAPGHQLCTFMPKSYLAAFSLPRIVPLPLARMAMLAALGQFASIDRGPLPSVRSQQFVVYRAFLGAVGAITITEHIVSGVSRSYLKFRSAARLSKSSSSVKHQRVVYRAAVA